MHTDPLLTNATLEFMNAAWFVLCLCALFIFVRYLWIERSQGYLSNKPALALAVYISGEAAVRGWIWAFHIAADHHRAIPAFSEKVGLLMSATVAAFGLLCIVRIFSPKHWGARAWVISTGLAVAAGLLSQALRVWI